MSLLFHQKTKKNLIAVTGTSSFIGAHVYRSNLHSCNTALHGARLFRADTPDRTDHLRAMMMCNYDALHFPPTSLPSLAF
mmetsp:Transcript_12888/g.24782  ORF Transcript_12888/g.24782 Transcript_12888/m.24782 type:complete len:80 (+) Transcript_12888:197-436(+)